MARAHKRKLPHKKQPEISVETMPSLQTEEPTEDLLDDAVEGMILPEEQRIEGEADETTSDLSSIYGMDDHPVDMTKLDQKHSRGRWIAGVILVLALVAGVVYLGYRVFQNGSKDGDVRVALNVEDRVASGDVVTIDITYENGKNVDLVSGDLEVFFPEGFRFQSAIPEPIDERNRSWRIEDVKPGAGGKIRIVGQLVGEKGAEKEFSALLTYRPANFSQDFQETSKATVAITSSIVELTVAVPSQIASGQEFDYRVEYTNTSSVALNNIKMIMNYPDGFTFIRASQEPRSDTNDEWRVDALQSKETHTLTVTGTLEGKSGDTQQLDFQLGLVEIDNSFNIQIAKTSLIVIVNPEVELTIHAPDTVVGGQEVPIDIIVKNTSDAQLRDVDVRLSFSGALFSTTEHTFKLIKELSPHEEKELSTSVTLAEESGDPSQSLEIVVKVATALVDGSSVTFPNQATATMKVKGVFEVTTEGLYYNEDLEKIGSGPLPPVVGETTTYIVHWNVVNGSNELADLQIMCVLPEDVLWIDDATVGVKFNETTRQVEYARETLKAGDEVDLEFAVSITPSKNDFNKLLVLTKETSVTALNTFTDENISLTNPRITTDLPNDEGASGKGVVEKE